MLSPTPTWDILSDSINVTLKCLKAFSKKIAVSQPEEPPPTITILFIFIFLFAQFAAGLVLYWTCNNILSIAQQWIIMKKMDTNKPVK